MKITLTIDEVSRLLTLPPDEQKRVLAYGQQLASQSDEEIAGAVIADAEPVMIHDMHRRFAARARRAVKRRLRKQAAEREKEADSKLSHGARAGLQWLRDFFDSNVVKVLDDLVSRAVSRLGTLSPDQARRALRQAYDYLCGAVCGRLRAVMPVP